MTEEVVEAMQKIQDSRKHATQNAKRNFLKANITTQANWTNIKLQAISQQVFVEKMRLKNVRRRRELIQRSVLDDRIEALKRWDNFREQKQMAINCIVVVKEMQQRCHSFITIGKLCCFLFKLNKKVCEVKA